MRVAYFYWDPDPEMVHITLPFLNRGILWYGVFFALGFFVGYCIFLYLLRRHCSFFPHMRKENITRIAEKVAMHVIIGTLIGARLGDVIFYQDWGDIVRHPFSVFKIWEGGLASHGAVVGIFIALWLFSKREVGAPFSFLRILDLVVIPTALAGLFIRVGNFFNQEILGTHTTLPWGIVYGHPLGGDRTSMEPRHPVQLYEALWYGCVFIILLSYFHKHPRLEHAGRILGLFFVLVFGFRFFIEYVKIEQSSRAAAFLTTGQWLSIPLFVAGVVILCMKKNRSRGI